MSDTKKITCEEALRQVFEYIDQELDGHKHDEMDQHMSVCRSCFSRLEFEKHLRTHVRSASQEQASDALKHRIKGLIKKL